MQKYLVLFLFSLVVIGCSKEVQNETSKVSDEPSNVEDEPLVEQPIDESPEIGLQFFGFPKSRDIGIGIFKTSYGYFSVEGVSSSDFDEDRSSNLVLRKLNEELESNEETIIQIDNDETLYEVRQLDEETYVITSNRYVDEERLYLVPIIRIFKDTGEIVASKIIEPNAELADLHGYVSDLSISNGIIYAAIEYNWTITSIVAFDINLNQNWYIVSNDAKYGKIYDSGDNFYFFATSHGENGRSNVLDAQSLAFVPRDTLWSNSYQGSYDNEFRASKIIGSGSNLYFIGQGGRETPSGSNSNSQGTVVVIDSENGEEKDRFLLNSFGQLIDAEIINQDLVIGGWTNESRLKIIRTSVPGDILWEYEYGPFQNEVVRDILILDNKIVFLGDVQTTSANDDREVVYGILNASDGKLQ